MDFDLTEEQTLLQDSVRKLLGARYASLERRNAYIKTPNGFDATVWQDYADAGLLALPFSEDDGGFGAGPIETALVLEQLGRALAIEPYLTASVLCGALIRNATPEQKAALLPGIIAGEIILALAHTEPGSLYAPHDTALTASRSNPGFTLNGRKSAVIGARAATHFIVTARTSGSRYDHYGTTLFLVDATTPGLALTPYTAQDGFGAAELSFENALVSAKNILGERNEGLKLLIPAFEETIAAQCAEAVGAMSALLDLTIDYLKTRKQFGVPLGALQALSHRTVDLHIALDQARSLSLFATLTLADEDASPLQKSRAVHAAKVQIGKSATLIGEATTQLHGGIGLTDEYKSGHYFKRLTMLARQFGGPEDHLRALASAGGLIST
jgi:alkylation response protein AidB-like acyl-CoA dehydrogenase